MPRSIARMRRCEPRITRKPFAGSSRPQTLAPERASIRKDLAYTLLKIGETEAARDQFAEAMRLDPADDQVALEYAFLCYETKQQIIARRVFDRLRKSGNATASDAFENVDRPLREGIARWKQALELSPDNFSAHEELARLAEQRDELDLAAEQYQAAWKLRPARRDLLLDLGRVWQEQGRMRGSRMPPCSRLPAEPSRASRNKPASFCRRATPTCTNSRRRWLSILRMTRCAASSRTCIWKWATRPPRSSSCRPCRTGRASLFRRKSARSLRKHAAGQQAAGRTESG